MATYLCGDNTYLAHHAIAKRAQLLQARVHAVHAKEFITQPSPYLGQGGGLFGATMVVVQDPSALPARQAEEFLKSIGETADVYLWDRMSPNKRSRLYQYFVKRNLVKEFSYLEGPALTTWLRQEAQERQLVLETAVAQYLVALVGPDQWRLIQEVEKLALRYATVTIQDLQGEETLVGQANIFMTIRAIAAGTSEQAVRLVEQLLTSGESELYILSMLAYQFRTLLSIRTALDKGLSVSMVQKEVGLPDFVVRQNSRYAQRFSRDQLLDILVKILATDMAIKSGKVDARTGVILLVLGLSQAAGQPTRAWPRPHLRGT